MKKKKWIFWILLALVLILVTPVPLGQYKDGGTREFASLTYKVVKWKRLTADSYYEKTRVYFLPDNFKSIDTLWEQEMEQVGKKLTGFVVTTTDTETVLESLTDGSRYRVQLADGKVQPGDLLEVTYTGALLYSDPPLITHILNWGFSYDYRPLEYGEDWVNRETGTSETDMLTGDFVITEIWSDCFFASRLMGAAYEYKFNGSLGDEWCVGDRVFCTYDEVWCDDAAMQMEVNLLTIAESNFEPQGAVAYKPVIYLYPQETTEVAVKLELAGELTCTYPRYHDGWQVTAEPDGTLVDDAGRIYNYLYWEGQLTANWDRSKGFCVKGEDTAAFLEDALEKLGLTRREANEFIIFWLPMMEGNPYNIISFQQEAYRDAAGLEITPAPDTLIRVFMTWEPSETFVELEPQALSAPDRIGFTAVEWGGTCLG